MINPASASGQRPGYHLALLLLVLLLAACANRPAAPFPATSTPMAAAPTAPATPPEDATPAPADRTLTVLYTNDEHGWLAGMEPGAGAAHLLGLWRQQEGYREDGPFLVLSGGDMWTGPAVSTWFDGESMAAVMNGMGYDAAAVGNHEFDFGLDVLALRAAQSDFPFLSANIRPRAGGRPLADVGISPYTLLEVNGITVGVIGLTTTSTPFTTNPVHVADYDFVDYAAALRDTVPLVQEQGAEFVAVAAHVCRDELLALAPQVADLGIHLLGGGHCNELFAREVAGMVVLEGGYHLTGYARASFVVGSDGTVTARSFGTERNQSGPADPAVAAVAADWQARADAELNVVIGYSVAGVPRRSPAMQQLVTQAWLWALPTVDVAITNLGGLRASLEPGEITLADVIGVLPFDNVLVELTLSGTRLHQVLAVAGDDAVAGARRDGFDWVLTATGRPPDPNGTYRLLVNDFMYAGGDQYGLLASLDPAAYNTAIDWRQPVIDWIAAQASSRDSPLDPALAALGDS